MKTRKLLFFGIVMLLVSCNNSKKVPDSLIKQIELSYQVNTANKGLFDRKPKLTGLKEPTNQDSVKLPDWITNKQYICENADAIKYNPALLIGALVRNLPDGRFEIYTVTYNVRLENDLPQITKIEKPTNFYEQTFNNSTRFNADFIIGGISIGLDEMVKITYSETNFGNLEKHDETKMENLKKVVQNINGANLKDWSIVRGIVVLDCTSTRNIKSTVDANVTASWISSGGSYYKQNGNTDNFRLISIDLEDLFLQ